MINKKLQKIPLLLITIFCLYPSISSAITDAEVWPEAYAGVDLIITGVDGEPADRTTDCVTIGQRYPVVGNFTWSLQGFTQSGNILTYTLETPVPRRLAFVGSISAKGNVPGSTLHYSVWHDGVEIFPRSVTGTYLKTAGEAIAMSVSFFIDIEKNDTLEVRTWSGSANEQVETTHLNYIIFPIGRQHQ